MRTFSLLLARAVLCMGLLTHSADAQEMGIPPQGGAEVPDPVEIHFPVDEFGISRVDWMTIEVEDPPAFGYLTINDTFDGLLYVPEWTEIEFDSFAISAMDTTGEVAFYLVVDYDGLTGEVDARHYFVASRSGAVGEKTPHWHHELPQGVFIKNGQPVIPGIDQDFINQKEYGLILRPVDHTGSGGVHPGKDGYNPHWNEWLEKFPERNNGRSPTKADVLSHLEELRHASADVYSKGVRPKWSYTEWDNVCKAVKKSIKRRLVKIATEAAEAAAGKAAKKAGTTAVRKGPKVIPGVGTIVSILIFVGDVYAGTPWDEALIDHGQDAIPVYGTLRGIYQIGSAGVELSGAIIDYAISEPTEAEIDDQLWDDLKNDQIPENVSYLE
jgi:hypothetical protein